MSEQRIVLPRTACIISQHENRVRCVVQEPNLSKREEQLKQLKHQCNEQQRYHSWRETERGYAFVLILFPGERCEPK